MKLADLIINKYSDKTALILICDKVCYFHPTLIYVTSNENNVSRNHLMNELKIVESLLVRKINLGKMTLMVESFIQT